MLTASLAALSGCVEPQVTETELFELAEEHLRRGHHDEARVLYQRYLTEHPKSMFADFAANRLSVIEIEVDAIMGRQGSPAPQRIPPRLPIGHVGEGSPTLQRLEPPPLQRLGP